MPHTMQKNESIRRIRERLEIIQKIAIVNGLRIEQIHQYEFVCKSEQVKLATDKNIVKALIVVFAVSVLCGVFINSILSERCIIPANYLVWEATRPLADCAYCANVTKPIILNNATRQEFAEYSYSSKPILVKKAIKHWRATEELSFDLFKRLYLHTDGSYDSLEDGCQFLNFKSDLFTLKEVFEMSDERARNEHGEEPWYVGWGNCHPDILATVRQYYDIPHFLPGDAEFPAMENIFFGYEIGAVMHLDYISRLMWQGQVKGNKIWTVAPVPECDHVCNKFQYYVEEGDVVLLDTRIWYHETRIPKGEFSLTVQSEYG